MSDIGKQSTTGDRNTAALLRQAEACRDQGNHSEAHSFELAAAIMRNFHAKNAAAAQSERAAA